MSSHTVPDFAPPQKLSIVGAFQAAPTPVKVLAASMYLGAVYIVGSFVHSAVWGPAAAVRDLADDDRTVMVTTVVVLFGLILALIEFLLGKGIARGTWGAWLLTLVLTCVGLPLVIIGAVGNVTVTSFLSVVLGVSTLGLLLTPVVRQHCAKR